MSIQVGYRGPSYARHFDDIFRATKPTPHMTGPNDYRISLTVTPGETWQEHMRSGEFEEGEMIDEFIAGATEELDKALRDGRLTIEIIY